MKKSIEYWQGQWDKHRAEYEHNFMTKGRPSWSNEQKEAYKNTEKYVNSQNDRCTQAILTEYANAICSGLHGRFAFGSNINNFFSGNWSRSHGVSVQNALSFFVGSISVSDITTENMLKEVKLQLGNQTIKPKDDLSSILAVIQQNTQVAYEQLDLSNYPGW